MIHSGTPADVPWPRRADALVAATLVAAGALGLFVAARAPAVIAYQLAERDYRVLGVPVPGWAFYSGPWLAGIVIGGVAAWLVARQRRALTPASRVGALIWIVCVLLGAKWQAQLESLPFAAALHIEPGTLRDGSMRLPLGLAAGFLAWSAWSWATGAPWRAMGDALAVWAETLSVVGRNGCLLVGCCSGLICPPWMAALCVRYPAGAEAHQIQLRQDVLPSDAALSLPVHPLPLYFSLAALAALVVMVWLLRRNAPPGSLLLTFFLVEPLTKLGLEQLRAQPRPPGLMVVIPLVMLAAGVTALVLVIGRRRAASD